MSIEDFNQSELDVLQKAVNERWKEQNNELMLADIETKLSDYSDDLTFCPAVVWKVDVCSFVILKTGKKQYRAQFFYDNNERYKLSVTEYHDLEECVTTLLKLQADLELKKQGAIH